MRNGHHHNQQKRMRGRNRNNNNRGHNPLTRVYESNGPDVKIRGTAHHIAEKYIQLARDSQSSGDPVSSEGYLQHAEHYFRLIAAAQAQFAQQNPNQPQQVYQRPDMDGDVEDGEGGEVAAGGGDPNAQPYAGGQPVQPVQQQRPQNQQQNHPQPQPSYGSQPQQNSGGGLPAFITGGQQPANGYDGNEQGGGNRNDRNDRNNRYGRNRNRHFRHGGNENRNNNYQGENQPQNAAPASSAPAAEQPQSETPAPGGNTPGE
jgi:hypothetical protein